MANNSKEEVEENTEAITLKSFLSDERIRQLEGVLDEYPDIVSYDSEGEENDEDIFPKDLIMRAYKSEKPLTSIEIHSVKPKRARNFIKDLEKFFFVRYNSYEIYISRFRSLCNVAMDDPRKEDGLSGKCPDLEGILYGYSPKEVARYCLKEELYHLIK